MSENTTTDVQPVANLAAARKEQAAARKRHPAGQNGYVTLARPGNCYRTGISPRSAATPASGVAVSARR